MRENKYQPKVIEKLEIMFPGAIITKLDPNHIQGIPDLLILYENKWAILEVKKSEKDRWENPRPNQEYYVEKLNNMSFSAFIFPENEKEVLDELSKTLKP